MKRRFEFVGGSSAKFYEVHLHQHRVEIRFGRLGTQGQTITKCFETAAAASAYVEKLLRQKAGKGYSECTLI